MTMPDETRQKLIKNKNGFLFAVVVFSSSIINFWCVNYPFCDHFNFRYASFTHEG